MAELDPDVPLLGMDVGGTHLRVGVVRGREVIWEQRLRTGFADALRGASPESALSRVLAVLEEAGRGALATFPECRAAGLAMAGFIEPASGILLSSPNLPGLNDADLVRPLTRALELPVLMENDALAGAWGEYARRSEGGGGLIFLGLGTGVGGGAILQGGPYRGDHGLAMEVGHIVVEPGGRACGCGGRGCLERYASATGVSLSYREVTGVELEAVQVAERARQGNPDAQSAFRQAGDRLAQVVVHLLKALDVSHVVIGGGLSRSWDLMATAFQARLDRDLLAVLRGRARISLADPKDQAGILGAALLAGRNALPAGILPGKH